MATLLWLIAPQLAGVILGIFWSFRPEAFRSKAIRSSGTTPDASLTGSVRLVTFVAGLLLALCGLIQRAIGLLFALYLEPTVAFTTWYFDAHYQIPLVLGIVGVVLLTFPIGARKGTGGAYLTPRNMFSFVTPRWVVGLGALVVLVGIIVLWAGLVSQPDDEGKYRLYMVNVGGELGMGTTIYGWYYSIPTLILIAVLIGMAGAALALIARPSIDAERATDQAVRKLRTRNVAATTVGAILINFGLMLSMLAGTASLRGNFSSDIGNISSWTTFAALEPVLRWSDILVTALGMAMWTTVLCSALVGRKNQRINQGSE